MRSGLHTIAAVDFTRPVWSPSIPCAIIVGNPQDVRKTDRLANVEDLGSHAKEKRM
jgi:hypothetical protein